MTEKRFDIVVQDKVARTIKDELTAIGNSARGTRGFIAQLKTEMAGLAGSARAANGASASAQATANRAATGLASLSAAQARAATSTERLTAAQAKGSVAAERVAQAQAKTALAQQKVATEAAKTAEAQSRANIAYLAEETALNRAVAAEQKAIASKSQAAVASSKVAQSYLEEERALNAAVAAEQRAATATARNAARPAAAPATGGGGTAGAESVRAGGAGFAAAARNIREVGTASKLSAQSAANLGFQLNDVGVSLASGQKPLTVFIQQGAQIAQIPAMAGITWKQFGQQALGTLGVVKRVGDAALDAAAAQAGTAAAAIAAANSQAASNVRVAETEVALATAQVEVAETATAQAAASARLTAANEALALSNGEAAVTAKALASAQGQAAEANTAAGAASVRSLSGFARAGLVGIAVGTAFVLTLGALNHQASDSGLKKYTKDMGYTAAEVKKLNAVTVGFGDTAKAVFQVAWKRVANAFGMDTGGMKKAWGSFVDFMASSARATVAGVYAAFTGSFYAIKRGWDNLKSGKTENPLTTMVEGYKSAYSGAQGVFDDVVKQSQTNARARQDKMAADMYDAPKAKKGSKGWDRAQELKNANAELDAQITLTAKYGDELERANQLEEIAKKFRDHNVPLTAAETAALEAKIRTLQQGRRVQEAMTAADEAANGASRKYEATLDALNQMLERGGLTAQQYGEQMRLATRAYEDATNPLASLNRELERNGELMGLYGRDRDVKSYIQQLEQAAEAQGKSIYQPGKTAANDNGDIVVTGRSKRLTTEAQGMVDEYKKQQQQETYTSYFESIDTRKKTNTQDPNDPNYVLQHHKELYAELKRLRDGDVISEGEAAQRKKDLDRAYLDARLSSAQEVLGQLSQLSSSKSKEIAAIGRAAAIAEATIDGFKATQKALSNPPGPPYTIPIAAVTAAIAAANVAKIAGVGFMAGGYTGAGGNSEVAGPVHRNEYVFDAAATKRIGVPALEAMRRGNLSQPANNNSAGGGRANIRVVQGPGTYTEVVEKSDGEIEVIAERVARRVAPGAVADNMGNPNGKVAGAMKTHYGARRNR